jgi:hypothetical protein
MELREIYVQTESGTATLEVKSDKAQRVSLIVQDKLGKPCLEQQCVLEQGLQSLYFPIGDLKAGTYFVWLHFENKTRMSSFKINAPSEVQAVHRKNPLFNLKLFSW